MKSGNIIAGLDLGTTKVVALIASVEPDTHIINILGIGTAPSEGLKKGVVVNIDKTVKSIQIAVEQAELQSGVSMQEAVVGIAGDHIQSFATRSIISIPHSSREIAKTDVLRITEDAKNIKLQADRKILHILPQDYIIDGQDGVTDPVGMSGVRMEANIHVITALQTAMQNVYKCVERAGVQVKGVVLEPLASSSAVLDDDEREVGVALIDIGGGTTDIAIFHENVIRHTAIIPVAGNQVTEDIAIGLGILNNTAEKIKKEYGHATVESILHDECFMIPGISGRSPLEIEKNLLARIIGPRMEEIFESCFEELRKSGYINRLPAGIVLTGGSALLRGSEDLAMRIFGMPVKLGLPSGHSYRGLAQEIENPIYSTAVGLVLHSLSMDEDNNSHSYDTIQEEPIKQQIVENDSTSSPKKSMLKSLIKFFDEL